MSKFVWAKKKKPAGWEIIEETLEEYDTKMKEAVNDPHEGRRKCESNWMVHRLHFEKNRYIYDLFYKQQAISKELYKFCIDNKIADGPLHSKWKKSGYETLCSLISVRTGDHNFGTTSVCRVPLAQRQDRIGPSNATGCISCASGDGGPIWWDELDKALAVAKEGKKKRRTKAEDGKDSDNDEEFQQRLKRLKEG
nr:Protein BUD31 homolog [Euglena gracilis]|eukprot:EG_transcript_27966